MLLYLENKNCKVAIKTQSGITKRIDIKDIVLQGTLWSGLMCTAQMDKLALNAYKDKTTYLYKGKVEVPPLEMVDDILFPTKCGSDSITANAKVNSFVETKKLKLSDKKCHKMHIGKMNKNCPSLNIHGEKMNVSNKEKYLGDILTNDGKIQATVDDRLAKGQGLIKQILTILSEIPLGKFKVQMGLHLRQAMLINGTLYNSEAWHCFTETQIKQFQLIDNQLLRKVFNAHSKTSNAFLHLETGTMPIRFIIASRRLNYLHNIMSRKENDLVLRVFNAQSESPLDGDFIKLIQTDFDLINEPFNKTLILSMNKKQFKKWVKNKVKKAAFEYLIKQKESDKNKKIQNIKYKNLKLQNYLKSQLFSNYEIETLFKLRSKTIELKSNFKSKYSNLLLCSVKGCFEEESQEHIFLSCQPLSENLKSKEKIPYKNIFSNTKNQNKAVKFFINLMKIRSTLLED